MARRAGWGRVGWCGLGAVRMHVVAGGAGDARRLGVVGRGGAAYGSPAGVAARAGRIGARGRRAVRVAHARRFQRLDVTVARWSVVTHRAHVVLHQLEALAGLWDLGWPVASHAAHAAEAT